MPPRDEFHSGATICLLLGFEPEELEETVALVNLAAVEMGKLPPITKTTDDRTGDTVWRVDGSFIEAARAAARRNDP